MILKKECKHITLIKYGNKMYSDGKYQMHRCMDCGTIVKGNKAV